MIKFWAFLYRTTGWYSPFARLAEYKHIRKAMEESKSSMYMNLMIGLWQAQNGFTRSYTIKTKPKPKKRKRK